MSTRPDVVVTGIGATTPIGGTAPETWQAMLDGRIGVVANNEPWVEANDLPVRIYAPLAVDPLTVLPRVEARRLDRCQQVALVAAREAWADAGEPEMDPERLGVIVGTGIGGALTLLGQDDVLETVGIRTFFTSRTQDGQRLLNFGTGAGITYSSDPQAEWDETELKAARLISLAGG